MKKFVAALLTVLFLGTTGMVLADDATPVTTPVAKKVMKHHKGTKKMKKSKKVKKTEKAAPAADSTTPTAQ